MTCTLSTKQLTNNPHITQFFDKSAIIHLAVERIITADAIEESGGAGAGGDGEEAGERLYCCRSWSDAARDDVVSAAAGPFCCCRICVYSLLVLQTGKPDFIDSLKAF